MDTEQLLRQGIAAARAGQRDEARTILIRVIKTDRRNEQAWLWLAAVVSDPEQQRSCLEQVLAINPANTRARQGLAAIRARSAPPATNPTPPPHPVPAAPPASEPPALPQSQPPPQQTRAARIARSGVPHPPATPLPAAPAPAPPCPVEPAPPLRAPAPPDPSVPPLSQCCPFCGAPTLPKRSICSQCHASLMVRAPRSPRSVALSFLGGLWGAGSVLTVGLSYFLMGKEPKYLALLIIGLVSLVVAISLLQRLRWAYLAVIIAAVPLALLSFAHDFCTIAIALLILIPRSYRDFYRPRQRLVPTLARRSADEHYQAGLLYGEHHMWYMATKEWEAAIEKQPASTAYRFNLGLAYARLNQFDRARAELRQALALQPDDTRIQKALSIVENEAQNKKISR